MDWILDHFQIVALVALAIGSWVKRSMDQKRAGEDERTGRGEMAGDEDVFGPGQDWQPPLPTEPPPLVRKHPPPLVHQATVSIPPLPSADRSVMTVPQHVRATKAAITGGAAMTRTRVSAAQTHAKAVQPVKSGLRDSLKKRKEIRRAIIMREILGPPVGLR